VDHDQLALEFYRAGVVRFGTFTLKDGRESPFYFDLRVLIAKPALLRSVAQAMNAHAQSLDYDCLAGIPYAGLPIAVAMALEANVPLVYPRKEAKEYGTKRRVEGVFEPGTRALVIDDVITTGGAKIEAIAPLREAGLVVEDILVVVDREQADLRVLTDAGLRLHSVLQVRGVLATLQRSGAVTPRDIERALSFLQQ
jgi:uridine monophosphate synthetase